MRFKLLHVRPHVWFFKQKETISKATSDDSSSEGPYIYKRSTSLKLVKSDTKRSRNPADVSKPSLKPAPHSQNQGKDVQVCTVVDAGCTCRATVSSQHKQKKAMAGLPNARGDLGSLHDVCRPRWAVHAFDAREDAGGKHDVCRPRRGQLNPSKRAASPPPGTGSSSVVSRLVCKSSQDVVKHSEFNVEHCNMACKSMHDEGTQLVNARMSYGGDVTAGLDVHQLECRLRNAGLEERRRSSKKKNKYYEEGPSISSGISSSNSTNTHTDSSITRTTTEMQDMLLNANPAFDMDAANTGDSMLSLEDLRASIAQRKLAIQASLCGKDAATPIDGVMDGRCENGAVMCSPSSLGSGKINVACRVSPPSLQNLDGFVQKETSNVKHTDVGMVNKNLCFPECNDLSNQGIIKQSQKASSDVLSMRNEAVRNVAKLPTRRASRRVEVSVQKGLDAQYVNRVNAGLSKGDVHVEAQTDGGDPGFGFVELRGPISAGVGEGAYPDVDSGQEKQVVSSSSCEIQVLSDYSYDHPSDGNHTYPTIRMCVSATSPPAGAVAALHSLEPTVGTSISSTPAVRAASHVQGGALHTSEANSHGHELMRSDSAVAMVKSSYDPKRDFKESMLEMVVAKRLRTPRQLQQLLQCYLSLNPSHYHPTIIKVFHELCSELFH